MRATIQPLIFLLLLIYGNSCLASDACSTRAIRTSAAVKVSDGSGFETESFFRSADMAAIRHIRDDVQTVAVEGPLAWVSRGDQVTMGEARHKGFALGHQYHALLLYFEDLVSNVESTDTIMFSGKYHSGLGGDYPYGGRVYLVAGDAGSQEAGVLFEFPDTPPIESVFSDWRDVGGELLPFGVRIDDGSRVFDYVYQEIETSRQSPDWFFDKVKAPNIDQVNVYRLHRRLLAAHCMGDADMMARLSAPEILIASRGELHRSSPNAMGERFTNLFERLSYTEYHDLAEPVIQVSSGGESGWIAVNVRAIGTEKVSGKPFDTQWAWFMLTQKINGEWRHAGNAANRLP